MGIVEKEPNSPESLEIKSLEDKLQVKMDKLEIDQTRQKSLRHYLDWIKKADKDTYKHSLRVGLLGARAAKVLDLDPNPLFYAGLLHDLGKVLIDPKVVKKQGKFSEKDMEEMKKHPLYGYYLLRQDHNFSAQILLRHHRFGPKEYPKNLPEPKVSYNKETEKLIEKYAKILSIIDFYDAASTRIDRTDDAKGKITRAGIYQMLAENYPDDRVIVDKLYKYNIFG